MTNKAIRSMIGIILLCSIGLFGGSAFPTCTKKTISSSQSLPAGCGVWVAGQKYTKVYDENGNFRAYCPDPNGTATAATGSGGSHGYGGCVN